MMIFIESTRSGQTVYSCHSGMTLENITALLEAIGHTNIQTMNEEDYTAAVTALEV